MHGYFFISLLLQQIEIEIIWGLMSVECSPVGNVFLNNARLMLCGRDARLTTADVFRADFLPFLR